MTAAVLGLGLAAGAGDAHAQQPDPTVEAFARYKAGVSLFRDGNARAALIEFRRAYELSPDPNVLFNIGQCHISLQDYVVALDTLEKVLREGGDKLKPGNKEQAQKDVETLKGRIARVEITVNAPGAEISIDDSPVGKAPLDGPITVSSGRRKVSAALEGRKPDTKYIDIGGGELQHIDLTLVEAAPAPVPGPQPPGPDAAEGGRVPWAGWAVAAGLGVGAVVCGSLALKFSGDLGSAKERATTKDELDDLHGKALGLAIATDVLIGGAVVAGAVSLGLTVAAGSSGDAAPDKENTGTVSIGLDLYPVGLGLRGAF
ncbi:MAG: PEGA domain-containing protein [Myxococcales bacterium]|nr:PEGA domain-containing protein [Myxococcales bacterium]